MLADLGRLMGFGLGRFAEGAKNARKAMELNPHFPTWYRWPVVNFLLSEGRFEEAAAELAKVDEPEMHRLAWSAIVQAKLGNQDAAREYREQLLQRYPRYTLKWIDDRYGMIEDRMDMWRDRFNAAGIPLE